MFGMQKTAASDASLIIGFNPVSVSILSVLILSHSLTRNAIIGIFLSFTGVVLIFIASPNVDIDFSDIENSISILPTGQSGNPFSKYYNNQAEMFNKGEFRKMKLNKKTFQKFLKLFSYGNMKIIYSKIEDKIETKKKPGLFFKDSAYQIFKRTNLQILSSTT